MSSPHVGRRLRVLVLSWNYPTPAAPQRGLWVERMCDTAAQSADVEVIVPTPWVPPLVPIQSISRFRRVPRAEQRGTVKIHFPRVPGSIEYLTHDHDASFAFGAVMATARRLHAEKPFDLIHAHFIYPEGVVASRIGAALGIPVMTSEHAPWRNWMAKHPRVRKQVEGALPGISLVAPVSEFLLEDVGAYIDGRVDTAVLPIAIDDDVFFPAPRERDLNELLYVGLIRRVKRVDVLVNALAEVRRTMPDMRLRILSANAYSYRKDRRAVYDLISSLGLDDAVTTVTGAGPREVAEAMRCCGFVAISSRRYETFCSVAAEAMMCGTPLVITRCGAPESFFTADDGVMVPADDPAAFAEGIREAVRRRDSFDGARTSRRMTASYGRAAWRDRVMDLYERVATPRRRAPATVTA